LRRENRRIRGSQAFAKGGISGSGNFFDLSGLKRRL
jgi:hypothetical protein